MLENHEVAALRVAGEPYVYVTESQVHHALTHSVRDYYTFVKDSLVRLSKGVATMDMPPKIIFPDNQTDGDFRVMPCVFNDGAHSLKTVKLIGTNTVQKLVSNQITVGKAFVIDRDENFISHIFEACLLSSARTAICACLAMESLGTGKRMNLVGAGRVGYYTALYALELGFVEELFVNDIDISRSQGLVKDIRQQFPDKKIVASAYEDLADTDMLVLATTSRDDIYHPEHFRADLVISVGADIDFQHELSPAVTDAAQIFVDTMDSIRYGDLKLWLANNIISVDDMTDLIGLFRSNAVTKNKRQRVFISTGTALFDNLTMSYMINGHGLSDYAG